VGWSTEALLGGLLGHSQHGTDGCPRVFGGSSGANGFVEPNVSCVEGSECGFDVVELVSVSPLAA
jgi:hypothetical protein